MYRLVTWSHRASVKPRLFDEEGRGSEANITESPWQLSVSCTFIQSEKMELPLMGPASQMPSWPSKRQAGFQPLLDPQLPLCSGQFIPLYMVPLVQGAPDTGRAVTHSNISRGAPDVASGQRNRACLSLALSTGKLPFTVAVKSESHDGKHLWVAFAPSSVSSSDSLVGGPRCYWLWGGGDFNSRPLPPAQG